MRRGDTVTVRLAAHDEETVARAESRQREQLPEPEPDDAHRVSVEFSYWQARTGASMTTRTLEVPLLDEQRPPAPAATASSSRSVSSVEPSLTATISSRFAASGWQALNAIERYEAADC